MTGTAAHMMASSFGSRLVLTSRRGKQSRIGLVSARLSLATACDMNTGKSRAIARHRED
jgi:hypothetical protein